MNYEQAKANYERTKADYEAAVNAWEDSRLYAPFDGYVQQAHIERYQDVKRLRILISTVCGFTV